MVTPRTEKEIVEAKRTLFLVRNWIKDLCRERNITPTELARKSKLTPSTITRIVNDRKHVFEPHWRTIEAIRRGLGVDLPDRIASRYSLTVSSEIPSDPDEVQPANDNAARSLLVQALEDGLEYVERFADLNKEPERGHCRRTIARMHAALAKARGDV